MEIDNANKVVSNSIILKYRVIGNFWSGGRITGKMSENMPINKNPKNEHVAVIRIVIRLFFIFSITPAIDFI